MQIAASHGAFNVRVFGWVVRGEETPESDIDFLINYDLERTSPWFPVRLIHDLEKVLGRKVDIVTIKGLKPRTRHEVMQEFVVL